MGFRCGRPFYSNVLSYYLKLEGPSCIIDTACSASLTALAAAYNDMKRGVTDAALVLGTNLCLHPYLTLQFARYLAHYIYKVLTIVKLTWSEFLLSWSKYFIEANGFDTPVLLYVAICQVRTLLHKVLTTIKLTWFE